MRRCASRLACDDINDESKFKKPIFVFVRRNRPKIILRFSSNKTYKGEATSLQEKRTRLPADAFNSYALFLSCGILPPPLSLNIRLEVQFSIYTAILLRSLPSFRLRPEKETIVGFWRCVVACGVSCDRVRTRATRKERKRGEGET